MVLFVKPKGDEVAVKKIMRVPVKIACKYKTECSSPWLKKNEERTKKRTKKSTKKSTEKRTKKKKEY